MSQNNGKYSRTQQKILDTLADGMRHKREELLDCLGDNQADYGTLKSHIARLRRKLRPEGQDIICEYYFLALYYRHVRLLASPYKE